MASEVYDAQTLPVSQTETRYGEMTYLPNDDPIGESLTRFGEWAKGEIDLLSQFLPLGSTVIDVGANIGTHSLAFAALSGAGGRVVAIEPQPAIFALLSDNVTRNGLSQVQVVNAGVGDRIAELSIPEIDYRAHINTGAVTLKGAIGTVAVPMITLDSLDLQRCDLLKIDTEGMEIDVLRGAVELIKRDSPVIYAEVNTVGQAVLLNHYAANLGYDVYLSRVSAFNPTNLKRSDENFFGVAAETSLLCLPKRIGGPRVWQGDLFSILPFSSDDELAMLHLATPRFGDGTTFDRNPEVLKTKLLAEQKAHLDTQSKLDLSAYRNVLLNRQIDDLEAEMRVFQSQNSGTFGHTATEGNEIRTLRAELADERGRHEAFRNMIISSSSWRLTRPLRYLRRLARI